MGWSELVPHLLLLVYQRLSFADFARARTICSTWYFVSRSSSPREIHIPWLIFKQDRNWHLLDPEECKFYKTHISLLGFADCRSVATCGNWVLVTDNKAYLYIINPFTLEIINDLPPLKSYGTYKRRDKRRLFVRVESAVLWVDERTKDYLVVWTSRDSHSLRFCMKGDKEWLETPSEYLEDGSFDHMVYKDKKLYILSYSGRIRILDFSQDFPREILNHRYVNRQFSVWRGCYDSRKMRLTKSGDVLIILPARRQFRQFQWEVYKMNSTDEKWEMVNSLDEKLVWNLCDYNWDFCDYFHDSESKASTYEILTRGIDERLRDLSGVSDDRWLLPCFGFEE